MAVHPLVREGRCRSNCFNPVASLHCCCISQHLPPRSRTLASQCREGRGIENEEGSGDPSAACCVGAVNVGFYVINLKFIPVLAAAVSVRRNRADGIEPAAESTGRNLIHSEFGVPGIK